MTDPALSIWSVAYIDPATGIVRARCVHAAGVVYAATQFAKEMDGTAQTSDIVRIDRTWPIYSPDEVVVRADANRYQEGD